MSSPRCGESTPGRSGARRRSARAAAARLAAATLAVAALAATALAPARALAADELDFGLEQHQALNSIYFTTVRGGVLVPLTDWTEWSGS